MTSKSMGRCGKFTISCGKLMTHVAGIQVTTVTVNA